MFWFGLLLGLCAGIILMGIITAIGFIDHSEGDYQAGYDHGFHEAMTLRGMDYGKKDTKA